jgi:putative ABC transport system permease protein
MMEFGPIFRSLTRNRARVVVIVAEVALTLAIVANCLSLILDTRTQLARPSGFDDEHIAFVQSNPYAEPLREQEVLDRLADQDLRLLRSIPGVRAAAHTSLRPWAGGGSVTAVRVPGQRGEPTSTQIYVADPGIFAALGMPIAEGRNFTEAEYDHGANARPDEDVPVIINRTLAEKLYPGVRAVGRQLTYSDESQRFNIVGVVDRFYNPVGEASDRVILAPARSTVFDRGAFFLVRTQGDPGSVLKPIEKSLLAAEKGRFLRLRTLLEAREEYHGRDRMLVASLNAVMALLVLVTALGIVGLTSFSVAERRRQIGTRRALGASRAAIVRHFLLENWMVTSFGVVLGAGLAYGLNFGIVTWVAGARLSPGVVGVGALGLWLLGIAAALGPALRGAWIAPAIATRNV